MEKNEILKEWTVGEQVFALMKTDGYGGHYLAIRFTDLMGNYYWGYASDGRVDTLAIALAKKDAGVL